MRRRRWIQEGLDGKSTMKILLWGWFGFENLGDDLLLETMLKNLDEQGWQVTLPMEKKYSLRQGNVKQIERKYRELFTRAATHDVLIIGPGGLFPIDSNINVLLFYSAVMLWKALHKKVIFFGIGISERLSQQSAVRWKKIISHTDLFLARSEDILNRLRLAASEKVGSMADVVFSSDIAFEKPAARRKIAVSVANLRGDDTGEGYQDEVKKWAAVVKELLRGGYQVDLIAFTKYTDDRLIDSIAQELGGPKEVKTIPYKDSYANVKQWAQYEMVIAMRFHALVLSVLAGVPVLPLAYGHKTISLAKRCGLAAYTLIWNDSNRSYYGDFFTVTPAQIIEKVELLSAHTDEVQAALQQSRAVLVRSSTEAMGRLKALLRAAAEGN